MYVIYVYIYSSKQIYIYIYIYVYIYILCIIYYYIQLLYVIIYIVYILYYIYYIYNIYIYSSKQIRWFENKNSCICSKTCQIMMAETESLWFKEGNDIRDEFFQAYFAILATADVVTKKCL